MKLMYDGDEILVSGFSSSATMIPAVLPSSGWDENQQQVVEVPGVLSDESKQLIIPVPFKVEMEQYYNAGILCIDQLAGQLKFSAETVPEIDLQVFVVIVNVQDGGEDGDVVYEWWSPEMTNDNTPAPYVASASSSYNNTLRAYRAFNGTTNDSNDCWHFADNKYNSWLQFDFGYVVSVSGIKLTPRKGYPKQAPSSFAVQCSYDNANWSTIKTFQATWESEEPQIFIFEPKFYGRYIRFTNFESEDSNLSIGDIQFYRIAQSEVT